MPRRWRPSWAGHPATAGLAVAALTAGGLALRILFARSSGLWRDEAAALAVSRLPTAGDVLAFLASHESHPPLFYLALRVWLTRAGDSDAAALALPVLLGAALVPVTYLVGARMLSRPAALIAAALVAASPILAHHAALVRPYSLLPLLSVLSVFGLWRALDDGRARWWAMHAASTLAALLTHNWAWLLLGAQWAAVLACLIWSGGQPRRPLVLRWLAAQVAIALGFAPWMPALLNQLQHAGHGPASRSLDSAVRTLGEATLGLPFNAPHAAAWAWAVGLVLAAGWQVIRLARGGDPETVRAIRARVLLLGVPVAAFAGATAASTASQMIFTRTLVTIAPLVLLAVGAGLAHLRRRALAPGVLVIALLAVDLGHAAVLLQIVRSNARELAAELAGAVRTDDLVVIVPAWYGGAFHRYYAGPGAVVGVPDDESRGLTRYDNLVPRMLDIEGLTRAKARLDAARAERRRVWLIMDRDDVLDVMRTEALPVAHLSRSALVRIRANQVRHHLVDLYGPPRAALAPLDTRWGDEMLVAMLFDSTGAGETSAGSFPGIAPPAPEAR
jgi:4-amino-4-deoxy-L-arabinose transferase-like glycosyltransferase